MTQGGPQNSTRTFVYYIYEQGFQSRNFGYACSVATVFFVIVVTMSLMLERVSRQIKEEGDHGIKGKDNS